MQGNERRRPSFLKKKKPLAEYAISVLREPRAGGVNRAAVSVYIGIVVIFIRVIIFFRFIVIVIVFITSINANIFDCDLIGLCRGEDPFRVVSFGFRLILCGPKRLYSLQALLPESSLLQDFRVRGIAVLTASALLGPVKVGESTFITAPPP